MGIYARLEQKEPGATKCAPMESARHHRSSPAAMLSGRPSDAVGIVRDVINRFPNATWCYRGLAAYAAWSGDLETARWAAQKLLAAEPQFTIERYKALPLYRNARRIQDRMVEGYRLAGVPEK